MIVSLLLALIIGLGLYIASHRLSGFQLLAALSLCACGVALVIFPNLTSYVAWRLGVGRGTDLLLYFAVVGGMFAAAHLYFRLRRQETIIAQLVRELALLRADAARDREPISAPDDAVIAQKR
ncbi:MAG TPA: DUF2304 domain-containing protein [Candidatus Acidoferrales bacterium]|nr:DUF2304 domain-containing protein [Candidatus Acidoferrales bacterium]